MEYVQVLSRLRSLGSEKAREGMARYGIKTDNALGVSVYALRAFARELGRDHGLALELWSSGLHEARMLACFVDEPDKVSAEQMESWVLDFDSWDLCDQCCSNLFDKTPFAYQKALEWSKRSEEFVKRAGFALMASLSVHDKSAVDEKFTQFFPAIRREAGDDRNYVKKAVNWALRQIGKRNRQLNQKAILLAQDILEMDSPSARWIAKDALRELSSEKVQARF